MIPVIDISDLKSPLLSKRNQVAQKMKDAASDVGFLQVSHHGIDPSLMTELVGVAKAYFSKPMEEKMENYIGLSENHSGYVPEGEETFAEGGYDRKESYDVNYDYREGPQLHPLLGPTQWPEDPEFREKVTAYYQAAMELGRLLFKGFALGLGLPEEALLKHVNHPTSQLRLIHYPFDPDDNEAHQGIGAHTDYECFTILYPTKPGLEVLGKSGEWIPVPLEENCFVINIGDMLEVLSGGRYVATSHRVQAITSERYSFPLFCALDHDAVIEPIFSGQVQKDHAYHAMNCGDHLYAQTIQSFEYLQDRLNRGLISLPKASKKLSSFGLKTET